MHLKQWWEQTDTTNTYTERFEEALTFNRPDTSFGFFDHAPVNGRRMAVMGNVQDMLYDQPKALGGQIEAADQWMRDQVREFVLHYFMRVSDFRQPQGVIENGLRVPPPCLRPFSLCPPEDPRREGFGFSQLFYKLRDTEAIGRFPEEEHFAIVDLRGLGQKYEWIVVQVRRLFYQYQPELTTPRLVRLWNSQVRQPTQEALQTYYPHTKATEPSRRDIPLPISPRIDLSIPGGKEMARMSGSIIEALDRIANKLETFPTTGVLSFPDLKIGEIEEVLLFSVRGHVRLHLQDPPNPWFFHITGALTDISDNEVEGSKFETVFPFDPQVIPPNVGRFPEAGPPFDKPPVDGRYTSTDTGSGGFSKTNFVFPDQSSIVTVGPSIPKLATLQGGAGQLWVASVGVIAGGDRKYRGARGLGAFNGSAYYKTAPDFTKIPQGIQELIDGFPVKVFINFKLIREDYIA
jgi:hypothetical protein